MYAWTEFTLGTHLSLLLSQSSPWGDGDSVEECISHIHTGNHWINISQERSFQAPRFPSLTTKDKKQQFLRQSLRESSQGGRHRLSQGKALHTDFCELVIFEGYTDGRLSVGLPSSWIPITVLRDGREQGHAVNHPEALWFVQEQKSCERKVIANKLRGGKPRDDTAASYFGFAAADTALQWVNVYSKLAPE